MDDEVVRLDRSLSRIQLLDLPYRESDEGKRLFQEICRLVLEEQLYTRLWSEPTLNQLDQLFQTEKPDEELFRGELEELHKRTLEVQEVNNFFFGILDPTTTVHELCLLLSKVRRLTEEFCNHLDSSGCLQEIRNQEGSSSEKVAWFLEFIKDDLGFDLTEKEAVKGALMSLKDREAAGKVNALLVKGNSNAILVPLHVKIQSGAGKIQCRIKGSEGFRDAVERAQSAMRDIGFLSGSEDVLYSLEFTDMQYQGSSLSLAAAVGMYDAKQNVPSDPYTAFTGEINLVGQDWTIKAVSGVEQKIVAAKRTGCRRVFIPSANCAEAGASPDIKVHGVDSLMDAFIQLRPSRRLLPGDSLQGRKVGAIQEYCDSQGWDLPASERIQAGIQLQIVPLEITPMKIQIYNSGRHTPKSSLLPEYDELLSILNLIDQPAVPIRSINESLNVTNPLLQDNIQTALEKLGPSESRTESYCKYSFKFSGGNETLTIKQYSKGKLTLQGSAGPLYKIVLECIVPLYRIHLPKANVSVESLLALNMDKSGVQDNTSNKEVTEVPLPHIGTDESGKGDYFGPMVIAGVLIDSTTHATLNELGVRDSKLLTDKRCRELAAEIRRLLPGKYQEVEIVPESYNRLYDDFKSEGKNLNHLLAWGHARAIESLLQKETCSHAVADQFGDEHYIQSKLMEKGKKLQLVQLPKGERYLAVAASSILARDKFLARLESLRKSCGINLPKGASDTVVNAAKLFVQKHGFEPLRKIAKLHHKTTEKIRKNGK
jgi:ribonuclease HIII